MQATSSSSSSEPSSHAAYIRARCEPSQRQRQHARTLYSCSARQHTPTLWRGVATTPAGPLPSPVAEAGRQSLGRSPELRWRRAAMPPCVSLSPLLPSLLCSLSLSSFLQVEREPTRQTPPSDRARAPPVGMGHSSGCDSSWSADSSSSSSSSSSSNYYLLMCVALKNLYNYEYFL